MSGPVRGWAAADRARVEIGQLLDAHDTGLSFESLAQYEGHFEAFCRDLFGIELTPQQKDGAAALETDRQVLIAGANGVGKDTLCALWSLYEVYIMGGLALLSGPTDRQVREVLLRREIGRLWRLSGGRLKGQRFEMAIRIAGREEGGLLAFTASDPDHFTGHHSATGRLFVGITEAQGIPADIFEAAQRCQPTRLLAVCNPTTPASAVYGFSQSKAWRTLHWSALDHPNVVSGEVKVRGAVDREWVESTRQEYGESSRFWRVSVLGLFPEEAESPLFLAHSWDEALARGPEAIRRINEARERFAKAPPGIINPPALGRRPRAVLAADIAGAGADKTAVAIRIGWTVWQLIRWRETDSLKNAERIFAVARGLLDDGFGVEAVVLDEAGEGRGVYDKFARLVDKLRWPEWTPGPHDCVTTLVGFKAARSARNGVRYVNARAESYDTLAEQFSEGDAAVNSTIDRELLADLREELLVHEAIYQPDDRLLIAPKDDIRRAIGRSPDLSDALSMTVWPDVKIPGRKQVIFG